MHMTAATKKQKDGNHLQSILESLMTTSSHHSASASNSQSHRRITADVPEEITPKSPYHLRISRLTVD